MKKILYSLIILASVAFVISCADDSLDPLPTKTVIKGTMLALRGDQLNTIYFDGETDGATFFANHVVGNETFDFDTEFLSSDPTSLASFDIYTIKKTWNGKGYTSERVLVTNIPGSQFKKTDDYANPWTSVSIKLTDILAKIGMDPINNPADQDTLLKRYEFGIAIQSDINLTDGTKVLSSQIQAAGLFQSDQFYPAQVLTYGVRDVADAVPVATITQRGQFSVSGGKAVHTILPLKGGAKDTIDIKFDQAIDVAPSLAVSPGSAGTLGTLVKKADSDTDFYVVYTATGTSYTGNVTLTVTGATSAEEGALNGLEMDTQTKAIAVDNLAPQLTASITTGTRVGKGGSVTITAKFNEKLGTAPKVTLDVTATKVDAVTAKSMTLSTDGLTATYIYDYKDSDGDAVHGNVGVTVSGGADQAGNAFGSTGGNLTIDIGVPPAPLMVADNTQFDWGTQIKWTVTQTTSGANTGGSVTGTVYFVAVTAGSAAPTKFVAGDAPGFTMATGVSAKQTGSVVITSGTSGSVFTAFTANGTLDVYAVFVGSTGNISLISSAIPEVQDLDPLTGELITGNNIPGNPITVTMN